MADRKTPVKVVAKATKGKGFTDEEKAAMKQRVKELQAAPARGAGKQKPDEEAALLAKIAAMPAGDRAIGERLHAVIKAAAPDLASTLWYGMPAYARNGRIVCHFQDAHKFKTRYATLGFSDKANLDEGGMWPVAFALKELTPAVEARVGALLKKAVS